MARARPHTRLGHRDPAGATGGGAEAGAKRLARPREWGTAAGPPRSVQLRACYARTTHRNQPGAGSDLGYYRLTLLASMRRLLLRAVLGAVVLCFASVASVTNDPWGFVKN